MMGMGYHSSKLTQFQDHLLETYTQYRPITRRDIRYILWVPNQGELRPSIWNKPLYPVLVSIIFSCNSISCKRISPVLTGVVTAAKTCSQILLVSTALCMLKKDVTMTRQPASETRDFHIKATWLKFVAVVADQQQIVKFKQVKHHWNTLIMQTYIDIKLRIVGSPVQWVIHYNSNHTLYKPSVKSIDWNLGDTDTKTDRVNIGVNSCEIIISTEAYFIPQIG